MSWRQNGRARVSTRNPQAQAVCDRCGFRYNLVDLKWQHDWRGTRLQNLYRRVCTPCLDKPFEHFRPIILPPDPVPVYQPRPDLYARQMPYIMTDTQGREITDTNAVFLTASSAPQPPPLSNANSTVTGVMVDNLSFPLLDDQGRTITADGLGPSPDILTNAQAQDRYILRAPLGGPVILIPD
ncbi:hypothetical protein ACELLULO517_07770 [Acidisoma cellulosilytica]|uniref:Uncharacterized protein n=1 Tax=Acidisoma cellulosilyticum TaxID=2802395 RepID=A0A963YZV7_9PROT|nr:hypothetical protein [Acidisoma cellulosilyticum]MCB8880129.1 hypothetical protein [Acidisoma cellulosilyticum]